MRRVRRVSLPRPSRHPVAQAHVDGGFALITMLWLITILAVTVGLGLAGTRLGALTTRNRIYLARARWAAEACLAIAQARWAEQRLIDTAVIDLGRTTRCGWDLDDPTARINVNVADPALLRRVLGDALAARVLEARRRELFAAVGEVIALGLDTALAQLFTVDGLGSVNANAASARVLEVLPGFTPEAVARIAYRRSVGRPIASLDELSGEVSPAGRAALLAHYADLAQVLTFAPPVMRVIATGWVGDRETAVRDEPAALEAVIEVLVVPLPERLAVIRRRMR